MTDTGGGKKERPGLLAAGPNRKARLRRHEQASWEVSTDYQPEVGQQWACSNARKARDILGPFVFDHYGLLRSLYAYFTAKLATG